MTTSTPTSARTAPATAVVAGRTAVTRWLETYGRAAYDADPHATPYSSPGWLAGWTAQLPPADEPLLLLAHDPDGRPAALPLVRTPASGGTLLHLVTALAPREYVAPLGPGAQHPEVAAALADALAALAADAVITLPYVPADSALGRELARRPHWSRTPVETAVVLLPWDPAALPRANRRQHARRDRRHADPAGPQITYHRTTPGDEDQFADAVLVLAGLHAARRPVQPAGGPDWPTVLARCADTASIAVLEADGRPVAAQLVLTRGVEAWSALAGMDPGAAGLAPGHAVLRHLLRDLGQCGYAALDLGPTLPEQHEYKAQYGPEWGLNWHFLHSTAPAAPSGPPPSTSQSQTPETP